MSWAPCEALLRNSQHMHGQERPEVRVLALVYALGGLLCLVSARWPLTAQSPVALMAALGGTGLVVAVAVLLVGRRWPVGVVHVGFVVLSALVALAAAASVTAVGVVGLGPMLIAGCLYAAQSFSAAAARAYGVCLLAMATAGAVLSTADGLVLPWVVVLVTAVVVLEVHGRMVRTLRDTAALDPLTGVANRRAWLAAAERDLAQARRSGRPYTVVVIDLDGFKAVNDSRGHAAGDALLRELSASWSRQLRRGDLLGRLGGDEFVLSLPGTSEVQAGALVERLREVHAMAWSAGMASSDGSARIEVLLARADGRLYAQKRAGAGTHERSRVDQIQDH
ncbi:GGDEF domain-containing protein [Quadrisphaera sp. INWT6]|uniref:GGDEF domain-containing protein n=1 Tax=Quadrisphaera sp. INWT6 TaxID=2596917 RepID=UPI001892498B|nr:GGDEF domain-containing protein [Quadrisphaera sp. INWT6]